MTPKELVDNLNELNIFYMDPNKYTAIEWYSYMKDHPEITYSYSYHQYNGFDGPRFDLDFNTPDHVIRYEYAIVGTTHIKDVRVSNNKDFRIPTTINWNTPIENVMVLY